MARMPRRRLDRVVVVDVESTCWEGDPPPGEVDEIIEIGMCLLDVATGERSERASILVRPVRSRVSEFCTRLTRLTQSQVEGGIPFAEACGRLGSEYGTKERLWASYGDYDRRMFERQCREMQVPYPFGLGHLNVKSLVALAFGLSREVGMSRALAHLGLPLEGTHHRAGDDAWNIAAILSRLLLGARAGLGGASR
jgi:inhibitor of KinA sporulation pathway (predicted exonuclease)